MARRKIIIPIDSILEMMKSYTAENHEIPTDARPTALLVRPQEPGKFAIMITSPELKRDMPPLQIHFDIRRIYGTI
jgi:hypothetical protein